MSKPVALVALLSLIAGCAGTESATGPSTASTVTSGLATMPGAAVSADALLGTWTVDLRAVPGAPGYYKDFIVTAVDGKNFSGTFYDTPVTEARINTAWGAVRIAFDTSDGTSAYHHSAVLKDGKLEGLSNVTGRKFLSYWSAVKK